MKTRFVGRVLMSALCALASVSWAHDALEGYRRDKNKTENGDVWTDADLAVTDGPPPDVTPDPVPPAGGATG